MDLSLEQWRARLEGHFAQLAATRANTGFPLFALEHGLASEEFDALRKLLLAHFAARHSQSGNWLLWVVYAAELGYGYDGDEYWQSYEEATPYWRGLTIRNNIRTWFGKFQTKYDGVIPSGEWAGAFRIITWPITHAILPKYLQRQLAQTLFDVRYQLSHADFTDPGAIGRLLAENAWGASSRLQEFLQQEVLAGRIALALLDEKHLAGASPLLQKTLTRIVSDLENVRSAREWLRAARTHIKDRFTGASQKSGQEGSRTGSSRQADRDERTIGRPTLLLRRTDKSSWSPVIEIPSLAPFAKSHPNRLAFLRGTRCRIENTGDTWLPAGWLLGAPQRRVLKTWPKAGNPLVRFEKKGGIDVLPVEEVRFSSGPTWLCRVAEDGIAREVLSRIVRPKQRYVLLSQSMPSTVPAWASSVSVACAGVAALALDTPPAFTAADLDWLHRTQLQPARTIRIWPAGLLARSWDGEGHSEWLTSETPCFGITHDHPVDEYFVSLDGAHFQKIAAGGVGHPVFIRLSALPVGRHLLRVVARKSDATAQLANTEGVVTLDVREPTPWRAGGTSYAGLAVMLTPHDPSLDLLLEGNMGLEVDGPEGRHITCSLSFARANGSSIFSQEVGTFELPLKSYAWQSKLQSFVNDRTKAWAFAEAASVEFVIQADDLGVFTRVFERVSTPLRWICRSDPKPLVRMVDDTGTETEAECTFHRFQTPTVNAPLAATDAASGVRVEPTGGLFTARQSGQAASIVVSTPLERGSLSEIIQKPTLGPSDQETSMGALLRLIQMWTEARTIGPLGNIRRTYVVKALLDSFFTRLCGPAWAGMESAYREAPSEATLQRLKIAVSANRGFAVMLHREYRKLDEDARAGLAWLVDLAKKYKVCTDASIVELAIKIASDPHALSHLSDLEIDNEISRLASHGDMIKGARLLALLAANENPDPTARVLSLPRWAL
ncbi:MAG: hypothetical protein JNL04_07650 [Rhodospirillaceae bacterium]|nr:hypothetical protein [Rhodospirillaceae bacterium]